MTDIVKRLRIAVNSDQPQLPPTKEEVRALLDEIERLRALLYVETVENAALVARLAEAVEVIKFYADNHGSFAHARAFLAKLEGRS